MSRLDKLLDLFSRGLGQDDLARRLGVTQRELSSLRPEYSEFFLTKRLGGTRRILAPSPQLKDWQRRIGKRVLQKLSAHPTAIGFERGQSIVTHARMHTRQAVVMRMDIREFFGSTTTDRVFNFFRKIGWKRIAAHWLTDACTYDGQLPQGAPTSPRLSNLVNYLMDVRLAGLAKASGAIYSRYADDLTFSFSVDQTASIRRVQFGARQIVHEFGYQLHRRKKSFVRRQHQQQLVCGLVVNQQVRLPRETRRWLRAVEHRHSMGDWRSRPFGSGISTGKRCTLDESQIVGWRALQNMIEKQR